jgi:hypothetical protein
MAKQKSSAFKGAINITHGLKRTAFDTFKKNGRAALLKYLSVDFRDFQVGVELLLNPQELSVALQVANGIT